jgi:hypothetical protein
LLFGKNRTRRKPIAGAKITRSRRFIDCLP